MKFLHRNKRGVSAGAFTESAYEVLNYEQLLKVNGAGGGSGGSGSGGPSGPSSSSGSSSSSSGYSSCGGGSTNTSSSTYSNNYGNQTNNPYSVTGQNMGESTATPKDILQPIAEASVNNHDVYGPGNTCDEFGATVISSGGFDPSDYHLGNTSDTVAQHISELQQSGFDYSTPSSDANVVFMGDGHNSQTAGHEHAGLLFMEGDGSVSFYHASSNNPNQYNTKETYSSVEAFESDFGYDSFYYQGIR